MTSPAGDVVLSLASGHAESLCSRSGKENAGVQHIGFTRRRDYRGWRLGEILKLRWSNVDFPGGEVRLWAGTTKNKKGRTFPMTTELLRLLTVRDTVRKTLVTDTRVVSFGKKDDALVVTRKNGDPIVSFRKWWRRACVQAKCSDRLFHDLRRSAVRNFVRCGVPERAAMTLTGHRTRSVFEHYNITSEGDLKAAAKKLEGLG